MYKIRINLEYTIAYIHKRYRKKQLSKKNIKNFIKMAKDILKEIEPLKKDNKDKKEISYRHRPPNRYIMLELIRGGIYFANITSFNNPFDTPSSLK